MLKESLYIGSLCLICLITWIYIRMRHNLDYWRNRGVHGPQPHILFGNFKECYYKKNSFGGLLRQLYLQHRHLPIFGGFNMMIPVLFINDPIYIEKILKTDFSCFSDRTPSSFARKHEMYRNLFNLNGAQWKAIRNKMAPVFTSLKLKSMTPQMELCFENTRNYIEENMSEVIDMKEVASVYSHDVIVQCLFGIESKELSRPGTRFRRMQTEFFRMTATRLIYLTFIDQFPRVADFFNLTHFSKKAVQYFQLLVENALHQRSNKKNDRNDLINILLKMREKRILSLQGWEHTDHEPIQPEPLQHQTLEMTDELLESQAIIFFHTGIESLVSSLVFAVYELARNPAVLSKLLEEVDAITRVHGLSPKALTSMTYLDMCIKETLRLYPVVPTVNRICSKRYELPCGLVLEPGESLIIPIVGLHVDEQYFPDPLVFKPERFIQDPPPFTYLPFGEGPRICFAMKFVTTELKVGLCKILQEFNFELVPGKKPLNLSSAEKENYDLPTQTEGCLKTDTNANKTPAQAVKKALFNHRYQKKDSRKYSYDNIDTNKGKSVLHKDLNKNANALDEDKHHSSIATENGVEEIRSDTKIEQTNKSNYKVNTNVDMAKWSMFMKPSGPVWIKFSRRQH